MDPDKNDAIANQPPLRDVIARAGLNARKSLGQHFLLDLNLTTRIARAAGDINGATVIEIGPGPGGLTRSILAEGADHIIAIEKDHRCRAALQPLVDAAKGRLELIDADALELVEPDFIRAHGFDPKQICLIANLPYNIATELIVRWLRLTYDDPELFKAMVITIQKEVGTRLCAGPHSKAYGRLSVMSQWLCKADIVFDIGARAFTPPPNVTSSVIRLIPRPQPIAPAPWDEMQGMVRHAFGQRRKMLRSSLKSLGADVDLGALFADSGVAPDVRAEAVDVEGFCALARAWADQRK